MVVMISSIPHITSTKSTSFTISKRKRPRNVVTPVFEKSMDGLLAEARALFEAPLIASNLQAMSSRMQQQYRDRLQNSEISMLPSYQHTLPSGNEQGDYLALDVGGSTFRIALIRLDGRTQEESLHVKKIHSFVIDKKVRDLKGMAFFDWMADRIAEILGERLSVNGVKKEALPMGLAWSFPMEQTSAKSGKLLTMGKGFCAAHGIEGEDINDLIMQACMKKGLNVKMQAIVNDGTATLLYQAYRDPSTRMSLILGTGTNAAVYLPISALSKNKFGERPDSWYTVATHVLVNTELSMFGKNVLPTTRWDDELNRKHMLPDFQPLEYLITGRYLAEIVRLILVEAIPQAGLFDGEIPHGLDEAYYFDTKTVAKFESDDSPVLANACAAFRSAHPMRASPTLHELKFIREIARLVSERAAAYLATALHALWRVRTESEGLQPGQQGFHITVACNGTVVEKYPFFRRRCQAHLDELAMLSDAPAGVVSLEMAPESSIFGAAVAVCCNQDEQIA